LNSISSWVFIGVQGAVTDLIKLVFCQVLASQPSSVVCTDSRPQVPFRRLLESITTVETHGRLQSGAGRPGSLVGRAPTWPTHQWPLQRASLCQVYSQGDTYFGRIPNFLVIH
jgi:hypothetical protein